MRVSLKLSPWRTLVLGVLTTAVLVWAGITRFDVPAGDMLGFGIASLVGLGLIVVAAFAAFLLYLAAIRLWRRVR